MTPNVYVYNALLAGCFAYAMLRGAAPERIGATIMFIGSQLTVAVLAASTYTFESVEIGVVIVDVAVLFAFLALAFRAERFWPLWVAAMHLAATSGHLVKFADPDIMRRAYAFIVTIWSYPMVMLIIIGTWRHQQRLIKFGRDRSWSIFRL